MATKATVLAMVSTLSYNLADTAEIDRIWSELLIELGGDPRAWFSQVAITDTGTVADYRDADNFELPSSLNIARLLALFDNGRQLSRETETTLKALDPNWQDRFGAPVAFLTDQRSDRLLRLYPKNTVPTQADDDRAMTIVSTASVRTTGVPDVMVLPLAMLVLAREFERESVHRDQDFAQSCRALGQEMLNYIVK